MSLLHSGTVAFLFTDIEGITKVAQEYSKEMPAGLKRNADSERARVLFSECDAAQPG